MIKFLYNFINTIYADVEKKRRYRDINMFACSFQPGLISHGTVFFSHNKSAVQTSTNGLSNKRKDCR